MKSLCPRYRQRVSVLLHCHLHSSPNRFNRRIRGNLNPFAVIADGSGYMPVNGGTFLGDAIKRERLCIVGERLCIVARLVPF